MRGCGSGFLCLRWEEGAIEGAVWGGGIFESPHHHKASRRSSLASEIDELIRRSALDSPVAICEALGEGRGHDTTATR